MQKIISIMLGTSCLLWVLAPMSASAQLLVSSADFCNVRNPGDPNKKNLRLRDGEIQNLNDDYTFNVTCPIVTVYPATLFFVGITAANYSTSTQTFRCTLEEYDIVGFKLASYTRSETLLANRAAFLAFEDIAISDPASRLYMQCKLPPGGAFGNLDMASGS